MLRLREDVEPCCVEWQGDGLRLEPDEATASCAGEGVTVYPREP